MPRKVTSKDQIGSGAAKKATKTVERRKRSNADAMAFARGVMRQGTDSQNSSKAKKPVRR